MAKRTTKSSGGKKSQKQPAARRGSKGEERARPHETPDERPSEMPPEQTNYLHAGAPGIRDSVPGAGVLGSDADAGPVEAGPRENVGRTHPGQGQAGRGGSRPLVAEPGADRRRATATPLPGDEVFTEPSGFAPETPTGAGDAPLSVPSGDQVGPAGGGTGIRALSDPNFSAAHRDTEGEDHAGKTGSLRTADWRQGERGHEGRDRGAHPTDPAALRARDVMSADVECATPQTELQYVARMMADRDVGAVPIVESTESMKLVGMITDRDIAVRVVAKGQDPYSMRASECMSTGIATVAADATIEECLRVMEQKQVRRVPVVDRNGRCVGIVAQADLARRLPRPKAGELVEQVSEPPREGAEGRYH